MSTGKRGGVSKGFHGFKVILILHVKCSLKKHCLFFTTTFSFGFLVVLGEGKREKENKDPRDEMLAFLTHFGRKAQL